jgi:hypothetical protein
MKKGRFFGGIICLAVAVLLAVLYYTLPDGEVVFMVGDSNMIWIPIIVLAGVGAGLIGTAPRRQGL